MGRGSVLMVVLVEGRAVVRNDRRGGGEDVGSGGRSRRGGVASGHAGVGRGPAAPGQRGGGGAGQAVRERLIVEEERALVDEALDDCLVGTGGG